MQNKNLYFKTNLNCSNCVAKVKPDLDCADGIKNWNVDTTTENKILTVESIGITADEVINLIKKKGFQAELVSE